MGGWTGRGRGRFEVLDTVKWELDVVGTTRLGVQNFPPRGSGADGLDSQGLNLGMTPILQPIWDHL